MKKTLTISFYLFLLLFLTSAIAFSYTLIRASQESTAFQELTQASRQTETNRKTKPGGEIPVHSPQPMILSRLQELVAQNPELAGWIQIEGTKIDYPVMLPVDEPEYYLNHAFDGSASYSGVPFMGQGSTESSNNIIIYGHHMKNGTMFTDLMKYKDKEFWIKHPVIRFDTLYQEQTYEVMGAFYSRVYYTDEPDVFRYYNYGGTLERAVFEEYASLVSQYALYDTGIEVAYGEQLITLSTCSYHTENGRFVVVARKQTKEVPKYDNED